MRQSRYQRYYNRGSKANWEAMKAADEKEATDVAKFLSYVALAVCAAMVAFIGASLSGFHAGVLLVMTAVVWIPALLILRFC